MANTVTIIVDAVDKTGGKLGDIGAKLGGMGKIAAAGIGIATTAVAGLATVIGTSIAKTMDWGQQLDNIGDVLGTTAEESAGLASMFKTIGGDSNQLTSAMALMSKGLTTVDGKLGPVGEALKGLGIDFKDAQGKMKSAPKLFQEIADVVGNMPEGIEKTSLMMDIFGKSGKEMGDALNEAANGGMDKYIAQAKEMGLALDPEQVIENKKAMATLELAFTGIAVQIGQVFLPMIQNALAGLRAFFSDPQVKAAIESFVTWLQVNIPIAMQAISDFWNTTLQPALNAIWVFIRDNVIPILEALAGFLGGALTLAFNVIVGVIGGVVEAFKAVFKWINDTYDALKKFLDFYAQNMFSVGGANAAGQQNLGPWAGYAPKASGGAVLSGRGYVVGERGPEYFSPSQSGTITPNHALGGQGIDYNRLAIAIRDAILQAAA